MRKALVHATGKTELGIINSLGDRMDEKAVPMLKPLATDENPELAEASIAALGKIGTGASLAVLKTVPQKGLLVYQAMLRTADRFAATGKKGEAEAIYISLAGEGKPGVVRASALRGLAALPSKQAAKVAMAGLKSTDPILQEASASVGARMATVSDVKKYTEAWPSLTPAVQVVLVTGFADKGVLSAAPLAMQAIDSPDSDLRHAGIQAAAKIGGTAAVEKLADVATHSTETGDRRTARESLIGMTGKEADASILRIAQSGKPDVRATLMSVLAERPTPAAMAALLTASQGSDPKVEAEALKALGRSGGTAEYLQVVKVLATTQNDMVRDAAENAVVAIAQRTNDKETAAASVITAMQSASVPTRVALLGALAEIGSEKSLTELTKATTATEPDVKTAAIAALAETWADSRAVPTLMGLAKSEGNKVTRVQTLRGALRLIGQDERAPAEDRVAKVRDVLAIAERPEEKRQALGILRDCRTESAVVLAAKSLNSPDTFDDAANTILYLAAPQRKNRENQPAVKGSPTTAALTRIVAESKDDNQKALADKLMKP